MPVGKDCKRQRASLHKKQLRLSYTSLLYDLKILYVSSIFMHIHLLHWLENEEENEEERPEARYYRQKIAMHVLPLDLVGYAAFVR